MSYAFCLKMTYTIGDITFARKEDITKHCQAILEKTRDGELVDEEAFWFLLDLFPYHEKWARKSASGISGITAIRTPHGTRCFALVRRDGVFEDISFPHTIKLIPTSRLATRIPQGLIDFRDAARAVIQDQIRRFRDKNLGAAMILMKVICIERFGSKRFEKHRKHFLHGMKTPWFAAIRAGRIKSMPVRRDRIAPRSSPLKGNL
jgi:hypothetical protein